MKRKRINDITRHTYKPQVVKRNEYEVRIIHRSESESNPGTLQYFDNRAGEFIDKSRVDYLQKTSTVYVIDLVTSFNQNLFQDEN